MWEQFFDAAFTIFRCPGGMNLCVHEKRTKNQQHIHVPYDNFKEEAKGRTRKEDLLAFLLMGGG